MHWEYRVIAGLDESRLNELGGEGWELAGSGADGWVLKRPALGFPEQVTMDQRHRYFGYWGIDIDELDRKKAS